ncbi:M48 family metalloprotease [Thermodesulfobacteriota bacterium]
MRYFLLCLALLLLLPVGDSHAFSFGIGQGKDNRGTNLNIGSLFKAGKAVSMTFKDISPMQEYYIGRTLSAVIINEHKPYDNQQANDYLNLLGQTLAQASDMPETFGGYHFLILDSDSINAFAAPGGLIFVTRGLIRCCASEDALAAVLAHEISHVQLKHGLQAIKKARITTALTVMAMETNMNQGGLVESAVYSNTLGDAVTDVTVTLVNNGYSKSFEYAADQAALTIMGRIGYNPSAMLDMLGIMKSRLQPGGSDFSKTHPSPDARISRISSKIDETELSQSPAKEKRYQQFLNSI